MLSKIDIDVLKGQYERTIAAKDAVIAEKDEQIAKLQADKDEQITKLQAELEKYKNS